MGKMITVLFAVGLIYAIPIVCRAILHWIQTLALLGVIVFILAPHSSNHNPEGLMMVFAVWVLGSLSALSLRVRERSELTKQEHEAEYHWRKDT